MNSMFKSFTQSLRIWHVAPLCLPLFLGSTSARNFSTLSPAPVTASPTTVAQLLSEQGISLTRTAPAQQPSQTSFLPASPPQAKQRQPLQYQSQQRQAQNQSQTKSVQKTAQKNATQKSASTDSPPQKYQAALAQGPEPARNLPPIPIRVAVAVDSPGFAVATSDAGAVIDSSGRVLGRLTAQTAVAVTPSSSGIQVGSWQTPPMVWIRPQSPEGLVYVGSRWYRGSVQVLLSAKGLLAINNIDLETYLYSVVGAEMPAHWPTEALKAQAIAARSYAVVHIARPVSDYYDLGATPRWQAYNGVDSETNTTHLAVNETRGLLLSYQGGVVESLYASSDQLVKEVHGGFGMSQEGAGQLAAQNLNYRQILGHFYPGTGLAVLNVK